MARNGKSPDFKPEDVNVYDERDRLRADQRNARRAEQEQSEGDTPPEE